MGKDQVPSSKRSSLPAVPDGITCWICLCGKDDSTEALLRGCACRGDAGYSHVSCLADAAEKKVKELLADNADREYATHFYPWTKCSLCLQTFTGNISRELALIRYERCSQNFSSPEMPFAIMHLCSIYMDDGEPEKALPLIRKMREFQNKVHKILERNGMIVPDHLRVYADTANTYGLCLMQLDKCDEAMQVFENALTLLDQGKPEISRISDTRALLIKGIAEVHTRKGDFCLARSLLRESAHIYERNSGKNTEQYIKSINALVGAMIPRLLFVDEAISLLRENVDRSKRLLGADHPLTNKCLFLQSNTDEHTANVVEVHATIVGVKARPEFNGKQVFIIRGVDRKDPTCRTRYECRLLRVENNTATDNDTFAMKPCNVIIENNAHGIVQGLVTATNYNGERCVIVRYDSAASRYVVKLLSDVKVKFMIKPENILASLSQ